MKSARRKRQVLALAALLPSMVLAHDPVFGLGPHTLYKDGIEVHMGAHQEKSVFRNNEFELALKYGITSDWVAGIELPYSRIRGAHGTDNGRGPTTFSTKYRFWRLDTFGTQAALAVSANIILNDKNIGHHGTERKGNDYVVGLSYGYEGRKWYRWASVRRRFNANADGGLERPNIWRVDLVGGIRFSPTEYLEPDWVWMLELNGEIIEHIATVGDNVAIRSGGDQWFIAPGLMWTYRNFAVKVGAQLPLWHDLSSDRTQDDYRIKLELEWHL